MKKRLTAMLFSALLCFTGVTSLPAEARGGIPAEKVEELRIGEEYRLEAGEEGWYRFTAPTPECYLTEQEFKKIDDYLYGLPVDSHALYSASGDYLGAVGYSDDPELGGWNGFTPGETYYLNVKTAANKGQFFTFGAVVPSPDGSRRPQDGNKKLTLTAEKVERSVPGYMTEVWDVYTLTSSFTVTGQNEICASDFFTAPFEMYFDNAKATASAGKVTYGAVGAAIAESWDAVTAYSPAPFSGADGIADGASVICANSFYYLADAGNGEVSVTRSYDICVPSGKRLCDAGKGCYRDARADDLYRDVPAGTWYSDAALSCAEKGYMSGTADGVFSPGTVLTRAQTVQILARICSADLAAYAGKQSFSDVPKGAWYACAVEWAAENGVTGGVGGGRFAPSKKVTRQELAVFLKAAADLAGAAAVDPADISGFADYADVAAWARDALSWAVGAGLINGVGGNRLSPKTGATRAQISLIVTKFDDNLLAPVRPSLINGSYFLEGGTCGYGEYDEMVSLTGKDVEEEGGNFLYIGFAMTDPTNGYPGISGEFTYRGFAADCLTLDDLSSGAAAEKIAKADLVWVAGGDSRMLLARLRKYGADAMLRRAAENGTVMCGSSAGAICFGKYGTSNTGADRYLNLAAVACLDLVICPHGFETARVDAMKELLARSPGLTGVAVDGGALEIKGGTYRIFSDERYATTAYKYKYAGGVMTSQDIDSLEWRPLSELFG